MSQQTNNNNTANSGWCGPVQHLSHNLDARRRPSGLQGVKTHKVGVTWQEVSLSAERNHDPVCMKHFRFLLNLMSQIIHRNRGGADGRHTTTTWGQSVTHFISVGTARIESLTKFDQYFINRQSFTLRILDIFGFHRDEVKSTDVCEKGNERR